MADLSAKQLGLTKSELPRSIIEVIATLAKAGFEAYIVGGGVRDNLLGLNPKDFDAVTNAKPQEIKDLFGKRCRIIGRRFQLAHVYSGSEMIEVATFRAPPSCGSNTTDEGMITRDNSWGNIHQDFSRRDFSINAMYYQPIDDVVKDFCDAIDDIKNKQLRLLGCARVRIEEDPVRLLRALRFKAKLGFEFNDDLAEQFNAKNWALLEQVSPHRLYDESQKMFTGGYIEPLLPLLYQHDAMRHLFVCSADAPNKLLTQVAHNTDKRIKSGKSINPAFFYAGLLWNNYLHQLAKNKKRDMPFQEAQRKASTQVINRQRVKTAIPKFAEQFIRDIWLLQPKLANPKSKHILPLFEHPRFRAGFDFLLLREQCGEEDIALAESTNGMGDWWLNFQTLGEKEQSNAIKRFTGGLKESRNCNYQEIHDDSYNDMDDDSYSNVKTHVNSNINTHANNNARDKTHNNFSDNTRNNARAAEKREKYPKRVPRSAEQVLQDNAEKAQLQLLSLVAASHNENQPRTRPSPLFQVDGHKSSHVSSNTSSDNSAKNNSSRPAYTTVAEVMETSPSNPPVKKSRNVRRNNKEFETEESSNVAPLVFAAEPMTALQEILLDSKRVPHERSRSA